MRGLFDGSRRRCGHRRAHAPFGSSSGGIAPAAHAAPSEISTERKIMNTYGYIRPPETSGRRFRFLLRTSISFSQRCLALCQLLAELPDEDLVETAILLE